MITGIDLFAGAGGTTEGAENAGVNIIWASNHVSKVVEIHQRNHPSAKHVCQDLQQADWSLVPKHDILFASPCCQGHSRAAGKQLKTKKADKSRSTAWAVVDCLEAHQSPMAIIENIPDFLSWMLYKPWAAAMKTLGYSLSINCVNASDLGIPQNRPRLFIVATRSRRPIELDLFKHEHVSARSIIDLDPDGYRWDEVASRVSATRNRVKNGRSKWGEIFLDAAYGSAVGGRSIDKPIGTITTVNKHSLVMGDQIRPISIKEMAAAQSFREDYIWHDELTVTKMMIGNAVPPLMAQKVTQAVLKAA